MDGSVRRQLPLKRGRTRKKYLQAHLYRRAVCTLACSQLSSAWLSMITTLYKDGRLKVTEISGTRDTVLVLQASHGTCGLGNCVMKLP